MKQPQPMTYPHQSENIKICPGCGASLMVTARRCAACGYGFTEQESQPPGARPNLRGRGRALQVTISLPVLIGLVLLLVSMNTMLVLGLQKRDQTQTLVAGEQITSTFVATTYVSPTPSPVPTRTPGPPTETPEVEIEYTVVSGDSCISIAHHFNLMLDSLLLKNRDLNCDLLSVGTVLTIPKPTATPEPTNTEEPTITPVQ